MVQGTFRSAIKRKEFKIVTDLAGVLDLDTKYTDLIIDSAQSKDIETILRNEHLTSGHHITIRNNIASMVNIAASLTTNGKTVDIEPGTTAILGIYSGKLLALGGTSETKDVEEELIAHIHGQGGISKIDPILSLDETNAQVDSGLKVGSSGWEYYNTNIMEESKIVATRMFS